jgi:hypothetical protein
MLVWRNKPLLDFVLNAPIDLVEIVPSAIRVELQQVIFLS